MRNLHQTRSQNGLMAPPEDYEMYDDNQYDDPMSPLQEALKRRRDKLHVTKLGPEHEDVDTTGE